MINQFLRKNGILLRYNDMLVYKSFLPGDPIYDLEGNSYDTVIVGNQVWMAQDLKTKYFYDGTEIPIVFDENSWVGNSFLCAAWPKFDISTYSADSKWGLLYGGRVIDPSYNGNKNIAIPGWHVPTYNDASILMNYAGTYDPNSTPDWFTWAGDNLRETGTTHWNAPNMAVSGTLPNNKYHFNAIGTGIYGYGNLGGTWITQGDSCEWWTSTYSFSMGAYRHYRVMAVGNGPGQFYLNCGFIGYDSWQTGKNIRLVKDS